MQMFIHSSIDVMAVVLGNVLLCFVCVYSQRDDLTARVERQCIRKLDRSHLSTASPFDQVRFLTAHATEEFMQLKAITAAQGALHHGPDDFVKTVRITFESGSAAAFPSAAAGSAATDAVALCFPADGDTRNGVSLSEAIAAADRTCFPESAGNILAAPWWRDPAAMLAVRPSSVIKQGDVGDCWLVAAMKSVAKSDTFNRFSDSAVGTTESAVVDDDQVGGRGAKRDFIVRVDPSSLHVREEHNAANDNYDVFSADVRLVDMLQVTPLCLLNCCAPGHMSSSQWVSDASLSPICRGMVTKRR